jgi:hypothetical protein
MVSSAPDTSPFRPASPHWARPNETHGAGRHSRLLGFLQGETPNRIFHSPHLHRRPLDPQHHHLHCSCPTCVRPAPPRVKGRGSGLSSSGICSLQVIRTDMAAPRAQEEICRVARAAAESEHGRRTLLRPRYGKSSSSRRPPAMAPGQRRQRQES